MSKVNTTKAAVIAAAEGRTYSVRTLRRHAAKLARHEAAIRNKPVMANVKTGKNAGFDPVKTASYKAHKVRANARQPRS